MTDDTITISWVRHGESIAQMIEGANDDFPFDLFKTKFTPEEKEEKEFKDVFLAYRTAIINEEFGHYNDFPMLKSAFVNIKANDSKKSIIPFANLQEKMTKDNVFIKKHFNSELTPSSWFFTPTLTSVGKKEAEKFGGSYLKKNGGKYDLIICSPTVRTIMTALYALDAAGMKEKEIMIMPHINEEYITNKNLLERANAGIPVEIIDEIIKLIKKYTTIVDDIKINTDFYKTTKENSEETDEDFYNGNFEKAKQLIVDNKSKKILAFVHGTFIKKRLIEANAINGLTKNDKNFFPHNCSLYDITYDGNKLPIYVASPYPNAMADVRKLGVKDDTEDDKTFCSLNENSLRGDINRLWIEHYNKCYDNQGDYKCGNVEILRRNYEVGSQRKSSHRGGKKNKKSKKRSKRTKKHKRKTSKKKY